MTLYIKCKFVFLTIILLMAFGCGGGPQVEKSAIFEGVDLKLLLVGSNQVGAIPALQATASSVPEYSFKDCECTLEVPIGQRSNFVARIMMDCSNVVAQLGGTISTNIPQDSFTSNELDYETDKKVGRFQLYTTDLNERQMRLIAILFECPKNR